MKRKKGRHRRENARVGHTHLPKELPQHPQALRLTSHAIVKVEMLVSTMIATEKANYTDY